MSTENREHEWRAEDYFTIQRLRSQGWTWTELGDKYRRTRSTVRTAYERLERQFGASAMIGAPDFESDEDCDTNEKKIVKRTSQPVKTLEDAIRAAEVDTDVWYVHSWKCKAWTVPIKIGGGQQKTTVEKFFPKRNGKLHKVHEEVLQWRAKEAEQQQQYLVELTLRRKAPELRGIEAVLNEIKTQTLKLPIYKRKPIKSNRRALEISVMDPHLGLRCFAPSSDNLLP